MLEAQDGNLETKNSKEVNKDDNLCNTIVLEAEDGNMDTENFKSSQKAIKNEEYIEVTLLLSLSSLPHSPLHCNYHPPSLSVQHTYSTTLILFYQVTYKICNFFCTILFWL